MTCRDIGKNYQKKFTNQDKGKNMDIKRWPIGCTNISNIFITIDQSVLDRRMQRYVDKVHTEKSIQEQGKIRDSGKRTNQEQG